MDLPATDDTTDRACLIQGLATNVTLFVHGTTQLFDSVSHWRIRACSPLLVVTLPSSLASFRALSNRPIFVPGGTPMRLRSLPSSEGATNLRLER